MNLFQKYIKPLFISNRFFTVGIACILFFVLAFFFPLLFLPAKITFFFFLFLFLADYLLLFFIARQPIAIRNLSERMSNGDNNKVTLSIRNLNNFIIDLVIIDELPFQLQERNFSIKKQLQGKQKIKVSYSVRPVNRGLYQFGDLNLFVSTQLGLIGRRYSLPLSSLVKVYPSFINLRNQQLEARSTHNIGPGSRRTRRIGQSMEFEQIKEYVSGDDIRTINWRATARRSGLMVNHFMEEKSQQVFAIIDKGRLMRMPFEKLSLLDYAINSTLALANMCLQKDDKFGLLTFSNTVDTIIAAESKPVQRENILQTLYNEQTDFLESDFESLYTQVRHKIKQRSLLILFTNFESMSGLKRQINYLRSIAKHHLLLVVFFENTELSDLASSPVSSKENVYVKTIAENFVHEKKLLVKELQKYGIGSILSRPQNLTVATLNKYIELKAQQAV